MHISFSKMIYGLVIFGFIAAVAYVGITPSYPESYKPNVIESRQYYTVMGSTVPEITRSMKKNGPNGYWGYTHWYVKWDGACRITVTIKYTMPKLANRSKVSENILKRWDTMIAKLKAHEKNHGQHGINAAKEIKAGQCKSSYFILWKWNIQDTIYDLTTNHGEKEGVIFK